MNNLSYNENLLKLLNNNKDKYLFNNELLLNLYLTLLSLNDNNYSEDIYIKELNIIENFLRKVNNLKVKIQLKRKSEEIEKLYNEIKEIYSSNKRLINNYNINNLEILTLLNSKEPNNLTKLIDNLTKEKIKRINNKDNFDIIRNNIINNIFINPYYIDNNILYIEKTNISIPLDEFYIIFDYLLNINNYHQKYQNETTNKFRVKLINNIINIIAKRKISDDITLISLVLTYMITKDIPNYLTIDTSKFNIDNIKITDLYSFANNKNNSKKTAKWKNISIPNEYLYKKIKELSSKGMYYQQEDKFIIENSPNDFKISISISDMKSFLLENILNTTNQSTKID